MGQTVNLLLRLRWFESTFPHQVGTSIACPNFFCFQADLRNRQELTIYLIYCEGVYKFPVSMTTLTQDFCYVNIFLQETCKLRLTGKEKSDTIIIMGRG